MIDGFPTCLDHPSARTAGNDAFDFRARHREALREVVRRAPVTG